MSDRADLGARCDRHVGEAFQPRCTDCDRVNVEAAEEQAQERHQRALERNQALGIIPGRVPRRVARERRF